MKEIFVCFLLTALFTAPVFAQKTVEVKVKDLEKIQVEQASLMGAEFFLVLSNNELGLNPGFYHKKDRKAYWVESAYPNEVYEPSGLKILYFPEDPREEFHKSDEYLSWRDEPRICLIYSHYKKHWLDEDWPEFLEMFDADAGIVTAILCN